MTRSIILNGAPAHAAKSSQQWLAARCADFINMHAWPPNSPDLNPLDYHDAVKKSITSFCKHLHACINTVGGHFEHSL